MATDVLVLGGFAFDEWSSPERLPFGGRQTHSVQRMPGGSRVVDCWGPDDIDRIFTAKFWGDDALDNALTLDAMRSSGEEVPYSNGAEARTVIIAEFVPLVVKMPQYVEFSITLVTTDDSGGGGGGGGGGGLGGIGGAIFSAIDDIVGADLSFAASLLS